MKKVKFKGNTEPCIQYDLLNETPVMEFDEVVFKTYVPCVEISLMGLIPLELIEETNHPKNVDAIDLLLYIFK